MAESKLAVASMDFAVKILKLCDGIKGHYSIVNQLERSATSIGANIREANYAHSKPDFVSKLQISLKECYETEYWLELMLKADILNDNTLTVYIKRLREKIEDDPANPQIILTVRGIGYKVEA